ncbi:MAG: hypothetical protein GY804_08335 [Alphaproteobacteria bacterium]|nr:hypothetical protein [Alphaproteobacteria bacterium]
MRAKKQNRWIASIVFNTPRKKECVKFSEIKDLEEIINIGPSWFEIDKVEITLNLPDKKEGLKAYKEAILFD